MQQVVKEIKLPVMKKSWFSKLMPLLLLLSFIWLNFYRTMTNANTLIINMGNFGSLPAYLFFDVLMMGLIDYIIFEVLFFLYRFFIGFSICSFMIPKHVLKDKFRLWYFIRNIILGLVFNLRFFLPFIGTYLCIFELMLNFLFIIALYFDLSVEYVEPIVGQFVFKTLAVPVVLYEAYKVIVLMAGVL